SRRRSGPERRPRGRVVRLACEDRPLSTRGRWDRHDGGEATILRNARIRRPNRYVLLGLIAGAAVTVTALLGTTAGANQKTATPISISAQHVTAHALKPSPSVVDVSSLPNLSDAAVAKRP